MASNDIKSTHDANPTGADDVTSDYYFQCVKRTVLGVLSDEGVSVAQLRSMLQIDPAPTDVFTMSIPDNSTDAIVGKLVGDYTHWMIVELGDPDPPIYTDTRFNEWPMPTVFSVCSTSACAADDGDWSTRTWYLYVKDTESVYSIPAADGTSGVSITPNDTLGPVWLSGTNGFTVDDSGDYTIVAPTDAGIGLAAAETYDIYVDDVPYLSKFTATSGNLPLSSGTYYVYAVARDESGNQSQSDSVSITIAALNIGTVGFTAIEHQFSETQPSNEYDVEISRTGTGAFDITVSTMDDTALAGTNFTEKAGETVHFDSGETTQPVTLTLTDTSGSDIKQAFLVIDYDSGTNSVQVGNESTRLLIEGSGVTTDGGYQMDSTAPYALTVEGESTDNGGTLRNSITPGQTDDKWVLDTYGNGTRTVGGYMTDSSGSANWYGNSTTLDIRAPYAEYELAIDSTAVSNNSGTDLFDLFMRKISSADGTTYCHGSLVRTVTSISCPSTTATITLDRNHGLSGGETIYFEGVTGTNASEYNDTAGLTVASATPGTDTFTITGMTAASPAPTATSANCLGADEELIGLINPVIAGNSGGRWLWENVATNQQSMYIDEAGTWLFRLYIQDNYPRETIDRFTIVPRVTGWNGGISEVNADNDSVLLTGWVSIEHHSGLYESTYSAGTSGTPEPNENNSSNLFVPLPTTTVEPIECT